MSEPATITASDILSGNRAALARAITLSESSKREHRMTAEALISSVMSRTGNSIRVAISGPPGVGKSSFIEAFGLYLLARGRKVAVLAIDPSSPITGGSILGDKTRMEELAKSDRCFIRPSPSSGSLGGVARHTREAALLCEAAGFDVVLIETVGIGQSEVAAASMTDFFVQLHQPLSGDELQGIKKGVMELADLVVVTKCDGASETAAGLAKSDLERALSLTRQHQERPVRVLCVSAHLNTGISGVWDEIQELWEHRQAKGQIETKRRLQRQEWFQQELETELMDFLTSHPRFPRAKASVGADIDKAEIHTGKAARDLISNLLRYQD